MSEPDAEEIEGPSAVIEVALLTACPIYRRVFILTQFTAFDEPSAKLIEKLEAIDRWVLHGLQTPVRRLEPVN